MNKNKVARIFKIYAIINAVAVFFVSAFFAINAEEPLLFFIFVAVGIFINFLLFACGELIQLLQDIKDNTAKSGASVISPPDEDEIPTL